MLQLVLFVFLMCGSLGATISKVTTDYGFRKQRQHTEPLDLDKNVLS